MPKKRRRQRVPAPPRPLDRFVFDSEQEAVLVRAIRSTCSECGGSRLGHGDVAGAVYGAPTECQRARFTEAVWMGMGTTWQAWWCRDCHGLGIFRPQSAW